MGHLGWEGLRAQKDCGRTTKTLGVPASWGQGPVSIYKVRAGLWRALSLGTARNSGLRSSLPASALSCLLLLGLLEQRRCCVP